ncbi:MAG: hypothetical protein EHM20_08030 [Alphaproteobacteria bacterium]|nr:MAG: hypothetical protein EHM20_08030 [Alphaproteobacteria bacterium]
MTQLRINITTKSPTPPVQLYMIKEDPDDPFWGYKLRLCAYPAENTNGCPGVVPLRDEATMRLDKHWQFYLIAINPGMRLEQVSALLGHYRALANGTGFGRPGNPKANYILGKNLDSPLPAFDKDRTFIRSIHTGTENNGMVLLNSFDGTKPQPLKPGKIYPNAVEQINRNDYLFLPETHRYMFCIPNNIKALAGGRYKVFPFDPDGGVYGWMGNSDPHVFIPIVSRERLSIPLERLWRVNSYQSPYKWE